MCSFGSCQTRFEFLSQFRKVRNVFECFVTQVQTRLPKTKCVWPMKINVICTVCDIPWYIYVSRGNPLSLVSVMHLWATLGCGVFSCHSNLVNHVRGSMSAPSVKSVAHRTVCAEISSSSDVKS